MIEFKGNISRACMKYWIRDWKKGMVIAAIIAFVVISIPLTVFFILDSGLLGLLWLLPGGFMIALTFCSPTKKDIAKSIPTQIYIVDDIITCKGAGFVAEQMLHNVQRVVDFGAGYHIIFQIGERDHRFLCDKSLLTQGTLEEFEALFKGKIVKKK